MWLPKVIEVGAGDLSFSAALANRLSPRISLTASTFDSPADLAAKHPGAAAHLDALKLRSVRVMCGVDAVRPPASLASQRFDHVIFNHPHLGVEDAQRHQSLLSHVFAALSPLLKEGTGRLHLTLVGGQSARWEAEDRAALAGLSLERRSPFPHLDGFERRRTLNNRSDFRYAGKTLGSTTLTLLRGPRPGEVLSAAGSWGELLLGLRDDADRDDAGEVAAADARRPTRPHLLAVRSDLHIRARAARSRAFGARLAVVRQGRRCGKDLRALRPRLLKRGRAAAARAGTPQQRRGRRGIAHRGRCPPPALGRPRWGARHRCHGGLPM